MRHSNLRNSFSAILASLTFLIFIATASIAQEKQYNENEADSALKSAARVDPSTLGMSLEIPFGGAPGRGDMSLSSAIRYSSKQWRIKYVMGWQSYIQYHVWTRPAFSENSMGGWSSSLDPPRIDYIGLREPYDNEGNPISDDPQAEYYELCYIPRINLHLPDGSSIELRKSDTQQCFSAWEPDPDFSGTFYSTDGSGVRFDADAGVLYLNNGGRYLFGPLQSVQRYNNHWQEGRWATQYIDRNGNVLNYTFTNATDTLGRTYANALSNTPVVGDQGYSIVGFGGQNLNYTLRWRNLVDVLSDPPSGLRYTSDRKCVGPNNYPQVSPYLFTTSPPTHVCADGNLFNPVVLSEVVLPNGRSYQFKYNAFGEIDKIIYPTGGYERFRYDGVRPLGDLNDPYDQANRGVLERWVSAKGDGTDEAHWQYAADFPNNKYRVTITAPDLTHTERLLHIAGSPTYFGFENPLAGKAYEERSYSSGNQMLRRSLTQWSTITPPGGYPRNPHVTKTVALILDTSGNALAATTNFLYDQDLNVISVDKYDFASIDQNTAQTGAITSIASGALLRKEETTFLVNDGGISSAIRQAYRDRNLLVLPTSTRVRNPAGTIVAQSEIKYDETAYAPFTYGAIFGWSDPGTTVRGMPTTSRNWLNTSGSWLESHVQYDQCGSPRKSWNALGNVSEVTYSSTYHFAYPTSTISADPDGGGPLTPLVATTIYDLTSGLATSTTDANNVSTTFEYNDTLNRLTRTVRASGTAAQNQSAISYDDVNRTVTTTSDLHAFNDNVLVSKMLYDGLGRTTETRRYEGGTNYIVTQQQYDSSGRAFKRSNPFRPWQSESAVWTTSGFDGLGRVTSVTTPDNAVVTTSYSGNSVTVTDQAGKKRKSITDALGRLKEVYEDPNGLNYLTSYSHDTLDNLITVSQGSQTRTFAYDSLKRLTSATNPESGTISYTYDGNGNLLTKTDARGVSSTYSYDFLNRNTTINYSDATPDIFRQYDLAPTNGKGRLNQSWQSGSTTSATYIDEYDPMGRPLKQRQKFETSGVWSGDYQTQRLYTLAGGVKEQTYPSGRKVFYNYDAAGRTNSFSGTLGDSVNRTYATVTSLTHYSPWGGLVREKFGTDIPLYHKQHYNNRGQLWDMRLSTVDDATNWNRGAIVNYYSLSNFVGGGTGTDTNGNLYVQQHWIPHNDQMSPWTMHQQNYDYDSLNRITWVGEYLNAATNTGSQHYQYDRWGNRLINPISWGTGINNRQFAMNPANNNRLEVPGGQSGVMSYDSAGNLTTDTYTGAGSREYDAENKTTKAWGWNNQWQEYTYNADGHRVRRKVNSVETWQVYGIDGELLAEYAASAAAIAPQKEYGYRNGQLLITAAGTQGCGVGYSGTKTWTATNPSLGHATGQQEGSNWAVYVGFHSPTAMVFGPYDSTFGQGQHTAQFWLMVDNNSGTDVVATVDVVTGYGGNNLAQRLIRRNEFVAANQWQVFTLEFNNPCFGLVESRVWWSGTVNMKFSQVSITATNTSAVDFEWLVTDQLGTPRMVVNKSGSLVGVKRHDYLPFGEELYAGVSSRTVEHGYTGDGVRQKFTLYERDNETGLDYAQARYYSSTQGRFTSVDAIFISRTRILDPQAINLYSYVRNNPLSYVDPNGEEFKGTDGKRVVVEEVDGQLIIKSNNASEDLIKLVSLINNSGSSTALGQFNRLNSSKTMINLKIDTTSGGGLLGLHEPHGTRPDGSKGALKFDSATNKFAGQVDIAKDANGNEVYEEATITLYEGVMTKIYSPEGVEDNLVSTFGHEAEHDLDPKQIQATKTGTGTDAIYHPTNPDGIPAQGSPYWMTYQIQNEIRDVRALRSVQCIHGTCSKAP